MAKIKAFKAWRYHNKFQKQMQTLVCPLFDVVSEKQLERLYENELNSIHLTAPRGINAFESAYKKLQRWKKEKILKQDEKPAIYVYYQYFYLANDTKRYCRRGFVCLIKVYDWNEQVLLRHEGTMFSAVNDRQLVLEKTGVATSPTYGLYTDPSALLETYMDEAMKSPLYEVEDYQGVRNCVAVINEPAIIDIFVRHIVKKQIILADGHHRYEAALAAKNKLATLHGKDTYNYHMMYFSNMDAMDFRILPTHRLVKSLGNIDRASFLKSLDNFFYVQPLKDTALIEQAIGGKRWVFALVFKNKCFKITLKNECMFQIDWHFPEVVKTLDLTVLHYFIFEKILNIRKNEQRNSDLLSYEWNLFECIRQVCEEEAAVAIITNDVTVDVIKQVCTSGYTMPPKSTFFYPKLVGGYLFHVF